MRNNVSFAYSGSYPVNPTADQPRAYDLLKKRTKEGHLLWHYTSWNAFESILRTDELWAFDYRFMNDYTELLHALKFSKGKFEGILPSVESVINQMLSEPASLPIADLLCMSSEFDSLEQWRAYSRSSVGVALAFDMGSLVHASKKVGFRNLECVYDDNDKEKRVKQHLEQALFRLEKFVAQEKDPSLDEMQHHMASKSIHYSNLAMAGDFIRDIALSFKDQAFQRENEIRFVSNFRGGPGWVQLEEFGSAPRHGFQARPGVLAPYSRIPLSPDPTSPDDANAEHPLVGLLVGPVAAPDVIRARIIGGDMFDWLKDKSRAPGYARYEDLVIATSAVPLR